jgi:hypothetical protein
MLTVATGEQGPLQITKINTPRLAAYNDKLLQAHLPDILLSEQ